MGEVIGILIKEETDFHLEVLFSFTPTPKGSLTYVIKFIIT